MDTERFLATAGELLAVQSTADRPGELHRALGFVLDFVGPGFTVERFESVAKPSALIYRGRERQRFQVILNAHLDVVPAPPAQFRPRREGDRLYARGAQDMKVSALVEAQVFRELAGGLPYPLALQLVTDEEVGGRDGTLHQIEQGVSGEFVVIGEHSGLRIVTDSKGMITATLRAVGRSGHSAYPWQGDNALVKLQRSLANLLAAYPVATEEAWRTTVNIARIETKNHSPYRSVSGRLGTAFTSSCASLCEFPQLVKGGCWGEEIIPNLERLSNRIQPGSRCRPGSPAPSW